MSVADEEKPKPKPSVMPTILHALRCEWRDCHYTATTRSESVALQALADHIIAAHGRPIAS